MSALDDVISVCDVDGLIIIGDHVNWSNDVREKVTSSARTELLSLRTKAAEADTLRAELATAQAQHQREYDAWQASLTEAGTRIAELESDANVAVFNSEVQS